MSTPLSPWDLDWIVGALRDGRERWQQAWPHPRTLLPLPSQAALTQVVEALSDALYPTSRVAGDDHDVDGAVAHTLEAALEALAEQVHIELEVNQAEGRSARAPEPAESGGADSAASPDLQARARALVQEFATQLPTIRHLLDTDLRAAYIGDPAADSLHEVLACYPGFKAITYHRFAHALHGLGVPVIARIIAETAHSCTGVDIHPGARIGDSFFIDHGTGVVIGGTAVIGNRVRLYQAVTLGAKRFPVDQNGHLVKGEPRHPIVEDDVVIYSGATILGRVTIGRGATIGGNVWLTSSVPAGATVTQAMARNETFSDGAGI